MLSNREATYQRRTGKWNRSFDQNLRADLDTIMDSMKNMMNDLYKFIAGPSHGKVDEQTGVWKEVVNRKMNPLKEIILEATEEQNREEAEENRRKKNIVTYKAKESAANDSESRKQEDKKIVEKFLSSIELEDKQIVKTIRLGRKTDEHINRPLLVSFNTEQDVIEINRKLSKMKEATAEIRNLRFSPDRSLKEKEEVRNLVTKAKNLNDQEEGNYV